MPLRHEKTIEETFRLLREIILREASSAEYRRLFNIALTQSFKKESRAGFFPALDPPLRIYRALGGPPEREAPLLAAFTAVHVAADILDDVADGELVSDWEGVDPNQIVLVSLDLMGFVKDRTLDKLSESGVDPQKMNRIRRIFSDGIHRMAEGQHRDLALKPEAGGSLAGAEETARDKSGAQLEMFSRAAAILGGAAPAQEEDFALFGRYIAMAGQIVSDCNDIWGKEESADLRNGRLTAPVAYALGHREERASLVDALRKVRGVRNRDLLVQIRQALAQSGALAYVAVKASAYKYQAHDHLDRAIGRGAVERFADLFERVGLLEEEAPCPKTF